jgi:hypothetical protein
MDLLESIQYIIWMIRPNVKNAAPGWNSSLIQDHLKISALNVDAAT